MRSSPILPWLLFLAGCAPAVEQDASKPDEPVVEETATPVDADGDGSPVGEDCDDEDAAVFPGADEACDGVDNDCDGVIDPAESADAGTWYTDADSDGWGSIVTRACVQPAGTSTEDGDCDDADAGVHPDATETCNGVDDDCDGDVDEDGATSPSPWFADTDADGYGDRDVVAWGCTPPAGYVADRYDCDDSDASFAPGADELCDGADHDCDGLVDEDDAIDAPSWYEDADGDRFGAGAGVASCAGPDGWAAWDGDCDDADPLVNPAAEEACDATDDLDCDGSVGWEDADGDGAAACEDCDDADASWQDGVDWYADADGDGFGDAGSTATACWPAAGYTADASDCDDADADTWPGAPEIWYDGVDQGCDGGTDDDADGDGWIGAEVGGPDCLDSDPTAFPGAAEVCDDRLDNNCDGAPDPACAPSGTVSMADADLRLLGESRSDNLGSSLAGIAGLGPNGGAFVVGASGDSTAAAGAGAAYLVTELPAESTSIDLAATATLLGEAYPDAFGSGCGEGGDLDGDGISDFVVVAYRESSAGAQAGATYVFSGAVTGTVSASAATAKLTGEQAGDRVFVAAGVGDLDADGYGELLVGAIFEGDGDRRLSGAAYLVHGPVTGTISLADAEAKLDDHTQNNLAGVSVNPAGDTDGDGASEFLVGTLMADDGVEDGGAAYLFRHAPSGSVLLSDEADVVLWGEAFEDAVGTEVASAGDVNADGYGDILVGATGVEAGYGEGGAAYLFLGPVGSSGPASAADGIVYGTEHLDMLGWMLAGAQDIDLDGYDDMLVGAFDGGGIDEGRAILRYGPFTGTIVADDADLVMYGEQGFDYAGYAVDGIGDMNGDAYPDFAVTAPRLTDPEPYQGALYVWFGGGL